METSSLIFSPDISGFTAFVTQTEIQHSRHIISELIEVILNSNELGLKVSEIEGDSVLFYRAGEPPKAGEIVNQSKKMFIDFHAYLRVIERDNVCQCGACRTASNLSLKFVTHYGELREIAIQDFKKLIGSDLILAHRLLKNSIPSHEYLMLSERYLENQNSEIPVNESWITVEPNVEVFDNFGEIKTKYIPLTPLRNLVPAPAKLDKLSVGDGEVDLSINIRAPIMLVHQVLIDPKSKIHWVNGIQDVRNAEPINRINTSHTCVFDDLEIHVVTKNNKMKGDEIRYTERGEAGVGLSVITDFKLKEKNGSTKVSLRVILERTVVSGTLFKRMIEGLKKHRMTKVMIRGMKKNLVSLKRYCEKLAEEAGK